MRPALRRGAAILAVLALSLAFSSPSEGRDYHRGPRKKKQPAISYLAIAVVDLPGMTITTEPKNSSATATKTYKLTPKTKVKIYGADGTLADLKPGMQVRVGAGMDAGIAEEISASAPPPPVK